MNEFKSKLWKHHLSNIDRKNTRITYISEDEIKIINEVLYE
jgi:hypothetical protein